MQDLARPEEGEIDCLIGYEYEAFHPVRKQAAGHLLWCGMIIGGTHPAPHIKNQKGPAACDYPPHYGTSRGFLQIRATRCQVYPKCGSCRCGQCHPGGKSMTLKEEREYKIIEDKLTYKADKKKWEAGYP